MAADGSGMRRGTYAAWAGAIVGIALLQSAVHLAVVLGRHRVGTIVDLDRSNGVPDLVSTVVLTAATGGAMAVARVERGSRRGVPAALAVALALLTLADIVHDGPHPASGTGWLVIAMVAATSLLLALTAAVSGTRTRATLAAAGCLLATSFLINGLDEWNQWFERVRGDRVIEYQIVAKEGLELVGWSLVALTLWDEALRRRTRCRTATEPASRARAASRRHAA
jgi:hypothetical protein